jgi:hypothetical protein
MGGDFPEVALVSPYSLPGSAVRGRIFFSGRGIGRFKPGNPSEMATLVSRGITPVYSDSNDGVIILNQ